MHASRLSFPPRQQGNTLIGVIIGLVIGLVIAVIVALAITKGSLPFTDKQSKTRAAEPNGGQIIDPNKPMYGKETAREAAKEVVKEAKPPAPDALQQVIATFKQDPVHEVKPEEAAKPAAKPATPAPAAAPATAAAAAVTPAAGPAAAPAKAADAGDDKWVYYLQAGAFRETADAEGTRAKLALLGFEASVSDRATDSGVLHRVRMGPFNQVEAMNRARTKLAENGVDVAVIRNQK